MKKERYEIANQTFILMDEELGLALQSPFEMPHLPAQLKETKEHLVLTKDKEGNLIRAYLEKGGQMHGQYRLFYPNGNIQGESFYWEGKLHGPSVFFSVENKILSKSWFFQGVQQGKMWQYYLSGKLESLQRFKEGQPEGKQEYFYEDGTLKTIMHYEKGQLQGEVKLFWPDGSLKRECRFIQGKKEGPDKIWNEQGVLTDEGEYREGQAVGYFRRRYRNGRLREEIFYHTPTRFDKREWDEEEKLKYEGVYTSDVDFVEKVWNLETGAVQERQGRWDGKKLQWE